jgi:hypothetical protein
MDQKHESAPSSGPLIIDRHTPARTKQMMALLLAHPEMIAHEHLSSMTIRVHADGQLDLRPTYRRHP